MDKTPVKFEFDPNLSMGWLIGGGGGSERQKFHILGLNSKFGILFLFTVGVKVSHGLQYTLDINLIC